MAGFNQVLEDNDIIDLHIPLSGDRVNFQWLRPVGNGVINHMKTVEFEKAKLSRCTPLIPLCVLVVICSVTQLVSESKAETGRTFEKAIVVADGATVFFQMSTDSKVVTSLAKGEGVVINFERARTRGRVVCRRQTGADRVLGLRPMQTFSAGGIAEGEAGSLLAHRSSKPVPRQRRLRWCVTLY